MERFCLTSLLLCFFISASSQVQLTKNGKTILIDPAKVLDIETESEFISVFGQDYQNENTSSAKTKCKVDLFKGIDVIGDSVVVLAKATVQYRDSIIGKVYTIKEMEKEREKGNTFFSVYAIVKDTTFYFDKSDIKRIRVRTMDKTDGGGLGIAGLMLIGTVATVAGTVDAINGDDKGFISIGVGVLMLGAAKSMSDRSKWFRDYQIENGKWAVDRK